MINHKKVGISIPAYNEAGFITQTLKAVPKYVDVICAVDDCSRDTTLKEMRSRARQDKRVHVISNVQNGGVGYSVKAGLLECLKQGVDYVVIAPGDNQCDLSLIKQFVNRCEQDQIDACRGNRFLLSSEIKKMPKLRWLGNSLYSFISKFVSGYYSLFDFQSSFGAYRSRVINAMNFEQIRNDYLFENSLWTELHIVRATVKEIAVPVIYKGEKSGINYLSFISRSAVYLSYALLHRLWQEYFLVLHPLGLFFSAGLLLFTWGWVFGLYVAFTSIGPQEATTATVMLSVIPFILGFQLLLQAVVLDIQNEPKVTQTQSL